MTTPGGIPAKEDHKAPGRSLAKDDSRRHGKTLVGATARPLLKTPVGPPSGPRQFQTSTAVRMRPLTQPVGQAPAWRQADLRGGPPLRHLSYLPAYMAPQAPLARARVDAIGDGQDWALPAPDKVGTPKHDALNAPCHVMRGINSYHCALSTSCVPLWQPLFL